MSKICTKCNIEKDIILFSNNKTKLDGKYSKCKECKSIVDKKYRESNLDKIKEKSIIYYQENKEDIQKRSKEWYSENIDKSKESKALYYQNNREKMDLA